MSQSPSKPSEVEHSELAPAEGPVHAIAERYLDRKGYSVRQKGLIKILIGVPLAVIWFLLQQKVEQISEFLRLIVPGFPGVLALIGILELITGSPLSHTAAKWDSLKGWQRGIFGTMVALAFLALVMFIVYLFFIPKWA